MCIYIFIYIYVYIYIYIYIYYHVLYILCVFFNLYLYNTVLSVLFCMNKDIIIIIIDFLNISILKSTLYIHVREIEYSYQNSVVQITHL